MQLSPKQCFSDKAKNLAGIATTCAYVLLYAFRQLRIVVDLATVLDVWMDTEVEENSGPEECFTASENPVEG